jgi:hypothetical protein
LKEREKSFPVCFKVVSLIRIWFMIVLLVENKKVLEAYKSLKDE